MTGHLAQFGKCETSPVCLIGENKKLLTGIWRQSEMCYEKGGKTLWFMNTQLPRVDGCTQKQYWMSKKRVPGCGRKQWGEEKKGRAESRKF